MANWYKSRTMVMAGIEYGETILAITVGIHVIVNTVVRNNVDIML
ncbi:MAG: hypothetical protein RR051_06120 [Clostridiales bacterium]